MWGSRSREDEILERIREKFKGAEKLEILADIGHDAFIFKLGREILAISQDMFVENVHFPSFIPPDIVVERALRAALCDIAACGAKPMLVFVAIGMPSSGIADGIIRGMEKFTRKFKVKIGGGDIVRSDRLTIDVCFIGLATEGFLTRSGAKPGEKVYLTGPVGDARLGLEILKKERSIEKALKVSEYLVKRFLFPQPVFGINASACTDLSDGLYKGLLNISRESNVGFIVEEIPTSHEFRKLSRHFFDDPISVAFAGGDDYEFLFTAQEGKGMKIGTVIKRGLEFPCKPYRSFEHF